MNVRNIRLIAAAVVVVVVATLMIGRRTPVGDGPYAAEVADAVPRIEKSMGLTFKQPPRVEVRSREQVREFLIAKFRESTPAEVLAGESAAYKLLGLVSDSLDLEKFYLAVLSEQVIGYYDPATKVLYIVEGADEKTVNITITHELVHALQDQYTNLDSLQKSTRDNDRLSALQAVIEGEAQYQQLSIMVGGSQNIALRVGGRDRVREMIRENQSAMPVFATAPMVIQESLLFPYLTGADFVQRFADRRKGARIFDDVPRSTEQLLHTDAYFGETPDEPSTVTLPAPRGARKVYDNDMGEFGTRLVLYQHLKDEVLSARAAAGWDGDRFVIVESGASRGIVWATVWDTTLEAAEFSDAMVRATIKRTGSSERSLPGGGASFAPAGRTVSIVPRIANGRAIVIYSDLPAGLSGVIDPAGITVTPR